MPQDIPSWVTLSTKVYEPFVGAEHDVSFTFPLAQPVALQVPQPCESAPSIVVVIKNL